MKTTLYYLLFLFSLTLHAQKEEPDTKEPIIYADFIAGTSSKFSDENGLILGIGLNYQQNHHLFSIRYNEVRDIKVKFLLVLPIPLTNFTNNEVGVLYGYRKAEDNFSYSFSAGISYNKFQKNTIDELNATQILKEQYFGFPLEANFRFFKSEKQRFRIYHFIPVGGPTSFGSSIGVKLIANVSKHSFFGLGITASLGIHKKY